MPVSEKERAAAIVAALEKIYPDALCALESRGDPWKLLIMARLSAQCKDSTVNEVCRTLFSVYPTPQDMAKADPARVESIIRRCGLYRRKARDLIGESAMLTDEFGGVLPDSMDGLLKFPGVGRKIANLLLGDVYHRPAVVVDTHCIRISGRLGLVPEGTKDPEKIEKILAGLIEPDKQSDFCHRIVMFGREYCPAKGNDCANCPLRDLCRTGSGLYKKTDRGCAGAPAVPER